MRGRIIIPSLVGVLLFLTFSSAQGNSSADAEQLSMQGVGFTWEEAKSRSVKLLIESKNESGISTRADIGSGFLISPDGLFVTAYHVMKYCLRNSQTRAAFSVAVNCSTEHPAVRYRAQTGFGEFDVELVSYLKKEESSRGDVQTPDETIKLRDFVIGRVKGAAGVRFPYWELRDFEKSGIDLALSNSEFELRPLIPPKKVFIAGYPSDRDFAIAHGFLNVTEPYQRGFFAMDFPLYDKAYLKAEGIPEDTRWGIGVANHMSGGAVIDSSGEIIGVVVNGAGRNAGILSIRNFLETFFSRWAQPGATPAVFLAPTKTPLYLKDGRTASAR